MRSFVVFIIGWLCCTPVYAQHESYIKDSFISRKDTLPLRILYPKDFDESKTYPLVIFLHGRGESGNDNEKQLAHGSKLFQDSILKYPAIVVFPQCPSDSYWSNVNITTDHNGKRHFNFQKGGKPTRAMAMLLKYFDKTYRQKYVDKKRVYIAGLSMGGMGTFEMLRRRPNAFAAAIAICGGDNVANVRKYAKKVNLWIFHGEKDDVVDPVFSKNIVDALQKQDANPCFTLFPNANHNSWDPAFAEPNFLQWLFSQRKK